MAEMTPKGLAGWFVDKAAYVISLLSLESRVLKSMTLCYIEGQQTLLASHILLCEEYLCGRTASNE